MFDGVVFKALVCCLFISVLFDESRLLDGRSSCTCVDELPAGPDDLLQVGADLG